MTVYYRITELAKERNITISELEKRTNLPAGTIYNWKNSKPNAEYLAKVAIALKTTSEYLLGFTDDVSPVQSDDLTQAQKEVAYFIDPSATREDIEQIKQLVEIAKLSKRRL
ncbi:helix-turn-helix domain-containing protein [Leuconostoc lactis]|uniref:helix-turn-helix domain-containing protein n=1 Tax=Leuconostoc lactis TaxID=1246 RepID=UPI00241D22BA|nr:helix-turn-helix transcriptional regulator [Leuconostoc lactis]WKY79092.1 helix-turn-helix transcriptional regulator [Leuconostoc lactis]